MPEGEIGDFEGALFTGWEEKTRNALIHEKALVSKREIFYLFF